MPALVNLESLRQAISVFKVLVRKDLAFIWHSETIEDSTIQKLVQLLIDEVTVMYVPVEDSYLMLVGDDSITPRRIGYADLILQGINSNSWSVH